MLPRAAAFSPSPVRRLPVCTAGSIPVPPRSVPIAPALSCCRRRAARQLPRRLRAGSAVTPPQSSLQSPGSFVNRQLAIYELGQSSSRSTPSALCFRAPWNDAVIDEGCGEVCEMIQAQQGMAV